MAVAARKNELDELLKLPEDDRLEIARVLLASLVADEGDELNDEDRQQLHDELDRSEDDVRAGRVRPGHLILEELRARAAK
jgi:hypothetical protein